MALDLKTATPIREESEGFKPTSDFDLTTAMPIQGNGDMPLSFHINNVIKEFRNIEPVSVGLNTGAEVSRFVASKLPEAFSMAFPKEGTPVDFEQPQDVASRFKDSLGRILFPTMPDASFPLDRPITTINAMIRGIPAVAAVNFAKGVAGVIAETPEDQVVGNLNMLKGGVKGLVGNVPTFAESLVGIYNVKTPEVANLMGLIGTALEVEGYTGGVLSKLVSQIPTAIKLSAQKQFIKTIMDGVKFQYGYDDAKAEDMAIEYYRKLDIGNKNPLGIISNLKKVRRVFGLDPLEPEIILYADLIPGAGKLFNSKEIEIAGDILNGAKLEFPPETLAKVTQAMGGVVKAPPGADLKGEMVGKEGIPKILYRGVMENEQGAGTSSLGKGLYSSPDKSFLKSYKFDKIISLTPEEAYPKNPLIIDTKKQSFEDWLLEESGEKNIRDFNKKYTKEDFVSSKGYDGVVAGNEVIKYSKLSPTEGGEVKYLYHGTAGKGRLSNIQREGLKTGQAIGATKDTPVYLADTEKYANTYTARKGADGYVLRIKKSADAIHDESTGLKGDYKITKGVNPENIEIKAKDGKFVPIKDYDFLTDTYKLSPTEGGEVTHQQAAEYIMQQVAKQSQGRNTSDQSDMFLDRTYKRYLKSKADEVGVEFDAEKLDKKLLIDKENEINVLLKASGKPSLLKPSEVKKVIRETTGQVKVGDLITEGEALKATLKGEQRVSKQAFSAGKRAGIEEQKNITVEQELNIRAREEARTEIIKLVSAINNLSTDNLPIDYKDKIEEIKSGLDLKNRTSKTLARRESMKSFVARSEAEGEEINIPIEQLEMLEKTSLNDMTMDDLRDIHQTIMRLHHLGKLKNKLIVAQDQRTFDEIKKAGVETITKGKGLSLESSFVKSLQEQNKDLKGQTIDFIKSFIAHNMRPELMINILDDFDTNGVNTNTIWNTLWEAEKNKIVETDRVMTKIKEIHKALDIGEVVTTKFDVGRFKGMTKDNAMFIYANSLNEDNLLHLYGSGITDEDISAIGKLLTDQEKQAVKDMVNFYDTEQWPALEKIYTELEGAHLGKVENYFPIDRLEDISYNKELEKFILERNHIRRAGVSKGFTKERVTSDKGFSEFSYFNTILRNFAKVEHYKAYALAIRDVNKYLNNTEIKNAIKQSYGETYQRILEKWLKDVSYNGDNQTRSLIDNFSKWVRTNYGISVLGLNILSMSKQPVSFLQGMEMAGKDTSIAALGEFISDPKKLMNFVDSKSPLIKHRAFTQERELVEIINQRGLAGKLGQTKAYQTIREKSMYPILIADRVTVVCIWKGAYDNALKSGMDEPDAVKEADRVIRRTQPMGSIINLPDFFRGPEYQKLFSIFRNQPNQNFNLLLEASLKFGEGKTPGGKFSSEIAFYLLMPAFVMSVLNRKRIPDAYEYVKECLNGLLGGTFLLGQLTGFYSSGFIGGLTPIDSYVQDAYYTLSGKKLETKIKALLRFFSKISGIPFIGPYRILTGKPIGKGSGKKANFRRR